MIKRMSLVNFRGYTVEHTFGPGYNALRGPNESGKSTVAEALAFAWLGTDAMGVKNPDHLISNGQDIAEVALETEHVTISRKKKRGGVSQVRIARHGLPAVAMTQTELSAMMKITPESFLSCWNVGYFMRLSSDAQMAVLAELSRVDRRALLMSILPEGTVLPGKIKLHNPRIDAQAVATERRQISNMMSSDQGALTQAELQLNQLCAANDIDEVSYNQHLNDINVQLEAHDFYRKASQRYGQEKMRYEGEQNRKGPLEIGILAARTRLSGKVEVNYDESITKLDKKYQELKEKAAGLPLLIKAVPLAPDKPNDLAPGALCSQCGQVMDPEHVKKVKEAYAAKLVEYNQEARRVATHNGALQSAIKKMGEELSAVFIELTNLKADRVAEAEALKKTRQYIEDSEKSLAQINALNIPNAPQKPDGEEEALRKEQLELSTAINVARRQATQIEGLRAQINLLKESIERRGRQTESLRVIERALLELPGRETKALLQTLAVEGVNITLGEEGKLLVSNHSDIPYYSLSSGRRMKVDLGFCKSLRAAAERRAPSWLFVDNADLMDEYRDLLPAGIQIFSAKVDGTLKQLEVIQY